MEKSRWAESAAQVWLENPPVEGEQLPVRDEIACILIMADWPTTTIDLLVGKQARRVAVTHAPEAWLVLFANRLGVEVSSLIRDLGELAGAL